MPPTVEAQAKRLQVAAAMDLLDCGWNWETIAAALRVTIEWIQQEVELAVAADMAAAGPLN